MTPAQILRGSGDELLAQSAAWRDRRDLTLIIREEPDLAALPPPDGVDENGVEWKNGFLLLPAKGRPGAVTSEQVKALWAEW